MLGVSCPGYHCFWIYSYILFSSKEFLPTANITWCLTWSNFFFWGGLVCPIQIILANAYHNGATSSTMVIVLNPVENEGITAVPLS